jgi:hypothetical protein
MQFLILRSIVLSGSENLIHLTEKTKINFRLVVKSLKRDYERNSSSVQGCHLK